ncbi:hypothetical protein NX059_010228 [Plenodomus lindquistii]|nr:hypothetical protein NX059_010228 [Plenodomus lindquistii]
MSSSSNPPHRFTPAAYEHNRRVQRLEQASSDRIDRIIEDTIGWNRSFSGKIVIGNGRVVRNMDDDAHLDDIKDLIEAETAAVFWSDGSMGIRDEKTGYASVLGAGVAWREKSGEVEEDLEEGGIDKRVLEWKEAVFSLGINTGTAYDTEIFGIAAALHLTMERMRVMSKPMLKHVRILSDNSTVLDMLERGDIRILGPAVSSPWALTQVYDFTDALVSCGVTVEFVWVKGHAKSEGNRRADAAAGKGYRRQMGNVEGRKWVKKDKVAPQIASMGTDAIEEWYWRVNKVGLCNGGEEGDVFQVLENVAAMPRLPSPEPAPLVDHDDDDRSVDMDISDDDE